MSESKCQHDPYWTGIYGTCLACRDDYFGPNPKHELDVQLPDGQRYDFEVSRGFVSQIRCTWADFLRVESRLIWVPGGTVECPNKCGDLFGHLKGGKHRWYSNKDGLMAVCDSCQDGRIPRPFVSSMQPITRVELTTWPVERDAQGIYSHMTTPEGYRFTRLKCEKCNGQRRFPPPAGGQMMPRECEKCEGQPLNEWTCDDWPVTFAMPEA